MIRLIIPSRPRDVDGFVVRRVLPHPTSQMVGPFIFVDQIGRITLPPENPIDVLPHPHIGIATVTYLFEGCMIHRDSTGAVQEIHPGDVNWMLAGKGIVHSERTPDYLRGKAQLIYGLQTWVALPKKLEDAEPSFQHIDKHLLPSWKDDNLEFRLILGNAFGKCSPVDVSSELYYLEVQSSSAQDFTIKPNELLGERAIFIVEGSISLNARTIDAGNLIVFEDDIRLQVAIGEKTRLMILGGEPFPEKRYIWWNFVSSSQEKIELAKEKWNNQTFPPIPGETGFTPLPLTKQHSLNVHDAPHEKEIAH